MVKEVVVNSFYGTVEEVAGEKRHLGRGLEGGGGLLCDEMGLGKTVELMQLVLCNKAKVSTKVVDGVVEWIGKGVDEGKEKGEKTCGRCGSGFAERWMWCGECAEPVHKGCLGGHASTADKYGYVCAGCTRRMEVLCKAETPVSALPRAKATLVVIPTSLLLQWKREIAVHVKDALTVEVFQGLRVSKYIPRRRLLAADVVLTTYEALRADIAAFKALRNPRTGLRRERRYVPTPIPLLPVVWHRIAFDESQMLGAGAASNAAEMAAYLHGTYRWCITGTPMVRSLGDAVRMLETLKMRVGGELMPWKAFLRPSLYAEDERAVKKALRQVMWRSVKEDVKERDLQLPPQVTEVVRTAFGPVERFHYASLQESVRNSARRRGRQSNDTDSVAAELLTMLRQGSCHPQVGMSGRRLMSQASRQALRGVAVRQDDAATNAEKRAENPLDMNEVLDALVVKAKLECEEALRSLVASSNGLAAVRWLQYLSRPKSSPDVDGLVAAVRLYRDVLSIAQENEGFVRLDSIQRMHVLFNLNEALDGVAMAKKRVASLRSSAKDESLAILNSLGSTLRDSELSKEVDSLRLEYIGEAKAELVVAGDSYKTLHETINENPIFNVDTDEDDEKEAEDDGGGRGGFFFSSNSVPQVEVPRDEEPLAENPKDQKEKLWWWHMAVAALLDKPEDNQQSFIDRTIQKLIDMIPGGSVNGRTLANRLSTLHAFPLVIESELRALENARKALHAGIENLPGAKTPTEAEVLESGQCQECREEGRGSPCAQCRAEILFAEVERRLYFVRFKNDGIDMVVKSTYGSGANGATRGSSSDSRAIMPMGTEPRPSTTGGSARFNSGLRYQGEVETILKSLAPILRQQGDQVLNAEISGWFTRLETVKKEFSEARVWLEAQRSLLARMDEVNMALTRLSLRGVDETNADLSAVEQRHRVPRGSLPTLNAQFTNEKAIAVGDFQKKRGSFVYLKSLRKAKSDDAAAKEGILQDPNCAVCLGGFEEAQEIAVLSCGHVFCCDCTLVLIRRASARVRVSKIACPTCRIHCLVDEINFSLSRPPNPDARESSSEAAATRGKEQSTDEITTAPKPTPLPQKRIRESKGMACSPLKTRRVQERASTFYDAREPVVGLIGAKTSAIIRIMRGIWRRDPVAKILVFSEWREVMSLISRALNMNRIVHINTLSQSSWEFGGSIDKFKQSENCNVLLLLLRRGGAGLNLTEAQHVILVEPSMNVQLELQAVGRVHRIGQTKQTFVHRIIIENTVEELILSLGDAFRKGGRGGGIKMADVMGSIRGDSDAIVSLTDEDGAIESSTVVTAVDSDENTSPQR